MPTKAEKQKLNAALFAASRDNKVADVIRLIEAGADVNARDDFRHTPLHLAAIGAGDAELVQQLINLGAKVNAGDDRGMTPLHYAAERGRAGVMQTLISGGAKVNQGAEMTRFSDDDVLPQHLAARSGVREAVMVMLAQPEVDVNAKTAQRNTMLHYAAGAIGKHHEAKDSIALLKNKGADDSIVNARGLSAATMIKDATEASAANDAAMKIAVERFRNGYDPAKNISGSNVVAPSTPTVKKNTNAPALPRK